MNPKIPKNLEAFFLETFLDAKPRTGLERLLTNRIIRILNRYTKTKCTNRYTKTKCNLDYKIVFAFAFMLDILVIFGEDKAMIKKKDPDML